MLVKAKKNLLRIPKLLGVALFALLFFFNIQIMLSDNQSREADLSLFGVKINLFESTYAQIEGSGGGQWTFMYRRIWPNGVCNDESQCQPAVYTKNCWPIWAWTTDPC